MRQPTKTRKKAGKPAVQRRQYDSPLRRQQAAETRERIVSAGAEIAHRLETWDWRKLTFMAVSKLAGISVRTVHRHFPTERKLHDAILQRLVEEAGVSLDRLELGSFAGVAVRVYRYLSSFAASPATTKDPSLEALDQQRREALLGAVVRSARTWQKKDQEMAAAMLDLFWNPASFERLSTAWHLDTDQAAQAITWVIKLIERAVREGRRPGLSER